MRAIVKEIGKIASSMATVLIQGESGTGKELIARVIHTYSSDVPKPFVAINCSAIVDTLLESELFGHEKGSFTGAIQTKYGKFELAEDGTIFLDEIAEMSLPLQAKLLRVLQEREFERVGGLKRLPLRARVVAATNRNLAREVAAGRFREDLYQRLKVVTIELPPLRERVQDIPLLAQHLLARIGQRLGKRVTKIPAEAMAHLMALPWPGNVRELENALIRAVVMAPGDMLLREHLPPLEPAPRDNGAVRDEPGPLLTLAEAEHRAISAAL
jgi:two-component system response regulator AtoC